MTELARPATNDARKHRELVLPTNDGPLLLAGGVPQTVNVRVDANKIVNLSVPGGSQEFTGGILWKCNGYALMLNFVFVPSMFVITEIVPVTPALWFSDTHPTSTTDATIQQACCVPSVAGTYSFNVKYTVGGAVFIAIDPKIVVTPIT
jgi:hypothetical protein